METDGVDIGEDDIKERWLAIQKRSYTNWINEVLRPTGEVVNDLVDDIGNGVLLCKLSMLLTMKKIKYQKNPKLLFQKQDNIQKALLLLQGSGCTIVNIHAQDILNKNIKLILGLMWQLVQHFHVFQSIKEYKKLNKDLQSEHLLGEMAEVTDELYTHDSNSKKNMKMKLISDINRRLCKRDIQITNLKSDWHDGNALCALVDYNVKGIFDLYLDSDPMMKIAESMIAAYKFLGIPQLIEPGDFMSRLIDEQTMSMYLSCFVHKGVDDVVVDLFEGIESTPPIHDVQVISLEDEEEETGAARRVLDTMKYLPKLKRLEGKKRHSLTDILQINSESQEGEESDEGIGNDILSDIKESLQVPYNAGHLHGPDIERSDPFTHSYRRTKLEVSLNTPDIHSDHSSINLDEEMDKLSDTKSEVTESQFEIIADQTFSVPLDLSEAENEDEGNESPGEVEPHEISLKLLSPTNQEKLREEITRDIQIEIQSMRRAVTSSHKFDNVYVARKEVAHVPIEADIPVEADVPVKPAVAVEDGATIDAGVPDKPVVSAETSELIKAGVPLENDVLIEADVPIDVGVPVEAGIPFKTGESGGPKMPGETDVPVDGDVSIKAGGPVQAEVSVEAGMPCESDVSIKAGLPIEARISVGTAVPVMDTVPDVSVIAGVTDEAATAVEAGVFIEAGGLVETSLSSEPDISVKAGESVKADILVGVNVIVEADVLGEAVVSGEAVEVGAPVEICVTVETNIPIEAYVPVEADMHAEADIPNEASVPDKADLSIKADDIIIFCPEISNEIPTDTMPEKSTEIPLESKRLSISGDFFDEQIKGVEIAISEVIDILAIEDEIPSNKLGISSEIKIPEVDIKMLCIDINTEILIVDVDKQPEDIGTPLVEIGMPSDEIEIIPTKIERQFAQADTQSTKIKTDKSKTTSAEIKTLATQIEMSAAEVDVPADGIDVTKTEINMLVTDIKIAAAKVEANIPATDVESSAAEIELEIKMPSFSDEIPVIKSNVRAELLPNVSITIPESKKNLTLTRSLLSLQRELEIVEDESTIALDDYATDDVANYYLNTELKTEMEVSAAVVPELETEIPLPVVKDQVAAKLNISLDEVSTSDTMSESETTSLREIRSTFTLEPSSVDSSETELGVDRRKTICTDTEHEFSDDISPDPLTDININFALNFKISEINKEFVEGEKKEEEMEEGVNSACFSVDVERQIETEIKPEDEPKIEHHIKTPLQDDEIILEPYCDKIYDRRYNKLLEKLVHTNKHFKKSSKTFTNYISSYMQKDVIEGSLSKCAYYFRIELMASKFDILVSGENVRFIDKPYEKVLSLSKKRKSMKSAKDPILEMLPNTRSSLKRQVTRPKKDIEASKMACKEGITMYTEIVQNYENLRVYHRAVSVEYTKLEVVSEENKVSYRRWSDEIERIQYEITMMQLIMSGQCVPSGTRGG